MYAKQGDVQTIYKIMKYKKSLKDNIMRTKSDLKINLQDNVINM